MSRWNPESYDEAWTRMAAAGKDPHGEVAFVERVVRRHGPVGGADGPRPSVLDAGCGTGRVAIELDRRGYTVVGTDVDPTMLASARSKAPHLEWVHADLASFSMARTDFDVVVMAGNVILFVESEDRPSVLPALAGHLADGGLLIAGFQLARSDGRRVSLGAWDDWAESAGLKCVERWSTWDEDAWASDADYAVSVHRLTAEAAPIGR